MKSSFSEVVFAHIYISREYDFAALGTCALEAKAVKESCLAITAEFHLAPGLTRPKSREVGAMSEEALEYISSLCLACIRTEILSHMPSVPLGLSIQVQYADSV